MVVMELINNRTGMVIERQFCNDVHDAKDTAIRIARYAGFLNFEKDRSGDLSAKNRIFKVDIVRV